MSELAIVTNAITLPGCTLLRVGLQMDENLSDQQLSEIGRTLNAMQECGLWWWGDYLCQIERRKGEKYAEAVEESGYSYSALSDAKSVCSRIGLSSREEELSYTHHREALGECQGDAIKALHWLTQARANKWSVAEMRKAIRLANATHPSDGQRRGQESVYDSLKGLKLWLRSDLQDSTPELRSELVRALEGMLAAIKAVDSTLAASG